MVSPIFSIIYEHNLWHSREFGIWSWSALWKKLKYKARSANWGWHISSAAVIFMNKAILFIIVSYIINIIIIICLYSRHNFLMREKK